MLSITPSIFPSRAAYRRFRGLQALIQSSRRLEMDIVIADIKILVHMVGCLYVLQVCCGKPERLPGDNCLPKYLDALHDNTLVAVHKTANMEERREIPRAPGSCQNLPSCCSSGPCSSNDTCFYLPEHLCQRQAIG
jgi:hypothetical protein